MTHENELRGSGNCELSDRCPTGFPFLGRLELVRKEDCGKRGVGASRESPLFGQNIGPLNN